MADLQRGDRIKELREQRHLTQPVVADRVGVTLRAYQEWEAGGGIQWENAKRLAKVLSSNPDFIMSGERKDTPNLAAVEGSGDALKRIENKLEKIDQRLETMLKGDEIIAAIREALAGL